MNHKTLESRERNSIETDGLILRWVRYSFFENFPEIEPIVFSPHCYQPI